MASKLIVEIQADGSLKTNASKMVGEEAEILAALQELASGLGGELTVEKHVPGAHHHHHGHDKGHTHSH
jgi:hypothetical protein